MIEQLKEIKYKEHLEFLNSKKEEIEQELNSLIFDDSLFQLEIELDKLNQKELPQNFSLIEKYLTKRQEYQEIQSIIERKQELKLLIEKEKKLIFENTEKTADLRKSLEEIEKEILSIKSIKDVRKLGFSNFYEALKFLEEKGIMPILTEEDKIIIDNNMDYESTESLVAVHKTNYVPTHDEIKTTYGASASKTNKVTIDGIEYEYSYSVDRDTVHTCLNGEVGSHEFGSWDNCKYAVLFPVSDIPVQNIGSMCPVDTFILGNVELTENAWILCPKDEVEKIKKMNPKVNVIGYNGESVLGYANALLTQLGYKYESANKHSWHNEEAVGQLSIIAKENGLNTTPHASTSFFENEKMLTEINRSVSLIRMLIDNNLVNSIEDYQNIMEQLKSQSCNLGKLLMGLTTKKEYKDTRTITGNNKEAEIFVGELQLLGINISATHFNVLKQLSEVGSYQCTKINIPEGATPEEISTIKELESILINITISPDEKNNICSRYIENIIGSSIVNSLNREVIEQQTITR